MSEEKKVDEVKIAKEILALKLEGHLEGRLNAIPMARYEVESDAHNKYASPYGLISNIEKNVREQVLYEVLQRSISKRIYEEHGLPLPEWLKERS